MLLFISLFVMKIYYVLWTLQAGTRKFGLFLATSLFLRGYGGCVQLITYWNKNMLHIRKFYFKEISRCHNAMNPKISDFYVFFLSWICLWFQTISSSTPISELTSRQPPLPHLPPAPNAKNYRKILCRHLLQKLPDLGKTWVTQPLLTVAVLIPIISPSLSVSVCSIIQWVTSSLIAKGCTLVFSNKVSCIFTLYNQDTCWLYYLKWCWTSHFRVKISSQGIYQLLFTIQTHLMAGPCTWPTILLSVAWQTSPQPRFHTECPKVW